MSTATTPRPVFGQDTPKWTPPIIERSAVLSPDREYRYHLIRTWNTARHAAVFIMLNPSTADGTRDDPTIRRLITFARDWGCGSLSVVNLFAFRTPYPDRLYEMADPIGPDNDMWIRRAITADGSMVVCAWGAARGAQARAKQVADMARGLTSSVYCLGRTKDRSPRHPLYVARGTDLEAYR